jgi:hypothetical protein
MFSHFTSCLSEVYLLSTSSLPPSIRFSFATSDQRWFPSSQLVQLWDPAPQLPTWRTWVSFLAWQLTLNLSSIGVPIINHAVASIGFKVADALKLPHRAKCALSRSRYHPCQKCTMQEQNMGYTVVCAVYSSYTCCVKGTNI